MPCHVYLNMFEDNNGVLILATMTPASKHIAIKYNFFKEHAHIGDIQNHKVTSEQQVAHYMTWFNHLSSERECHTTENAHGKIMHSCM